MNSKIRGVYSTIGKVAPLYDRLSNIIGYRKSVDYFVSKLPFSKDDSFRVLDAGCGTGPYLMAILEKYKNAQVTAFDFNEKLVERLKTRVSKKNFKNEINLFAGDIQGSISELGEEKFDLIIVSGVFEYLPIEKVIINLLRFLKPDGYFLHSPVKDNFLGKVVCKIYACKARSREENIKVFENNGFILQKILKMPWNALIPFKEAHLFKCQILTTRKCVPCEGGVPPLLKEEIKRYLLQLKDGWKVLDNKKINKILKFQDFKQAIDFVNKVAILAEQEGHHPDIAIHYNKVNIILWTHSIDGLSENDFILAAKIDKI
jgi:4a-hydroxytetrahydrobiopterin dehydratase